MKTWMDAFCGMWMVSLLAIGVAKAESPDGAALHRAKPGVWELSEAGLPAGELTLEIVDGQTGQPLQWTDDANGAAADAWSSHGAGLQLDHRLTTAGGLHIWSVTIRNVGDKQRWLEPALVLQLADAGDNLTFWSGDSDSEPVTQRAQPGEPWRNDSIKGRMPMLGIYSDQQGVMIGQHPMDLFSYLSASLEAGEQQLQLRTAVRTVLDPGAEAVVRFVFGAFDPQFDGVRGAAQTYHDAFPTSFMPGDKVHRYLFGVSTHYQMHRAKYDHTLETMRRFGATWEWVYAPYKRTGDPWGEVDLWDYTPYAGKFHITPMFGLGPVDFNTCDRETFLRQREQYFNHWGPLIGLTWHMAAGSWVEKQLVHERYPDAPIEDPNVRPERSPWVTHHDMDVLVLPWYTSFQPVLEQNYKRIAETYDITGIAFDVARGGPRYRGPAIEQDLPIRAYDDQGVFIDQGVAVAKLADYLRTLPVRFSPEHRIGLVGNPEVVGQTFMTTVRYDTAMFEGPPYDEHRDSVPTSRLILGTKPMTWWSGWRYSRLIEPAWKDQSRQSFIETMNKLVDYVLFQSYMWAAMPTANYMWGVPELGRQMPYLQETIRMGWQARVPVDYQFDGVLYFARYGNGAKTRFFWGNPYENARPMDIAIHNRYLGGASYIFADRFPDGEPLTNDIDAGVTRLRLPMPSRKVILHQAVLGFESQTIQCNATASMSDSFADREVAVDVMIETPQRVALVAPDYAGYELKTLKVGGRLVPVEHADAGYRTQPVDWPAGETKVELNYHLSVAHLTQDQLASFKFLNDDGDAIFTIVATGEASPSAERLTEFFSYYAQQVLRNATLTIPVNPDSKPAGEQARVVLRVDAQSPAGVSMPDPHTILVCGASFDEMDESLLWLLSKLGERFEDYPPMRPAWGMGNDILNHFKMIGKQLPEDAE